MRSSKSAISGIAAAALASGTVLLVQLAGTTSAGAVTAADATFVTANEQSNLAEISLGKLGGMRGRDSATKDLASTTLSDHMTAMTKLTSAAKQAGARLPQSPNSMQLAVANQLKRVPGKSFDLMYAQAEVTGHELALAGARTERDTTTNAELKSYAVYYIGIATMHLHMAQAEVQALGGSPTAVPAGSGGAAATNTANGTTHDLGYGAGALLIGGGLVILIRRRKSALAG